MWNLDTSYEEKMSSHFIKHNIDMILVLIWLSMFEAQKKLVGIFLISKKQLVVIKYLKFFLKTPKFFQSLNVKKISSIGAYIVKLF